MNVTDAFAATLTPAETIQTSDASSDIDRQDFLQLLVAQLQNQDPLNPLESAEFSAQLAQFSSLEQLMEINSGIESLQKDDTTPNVDALGLLGHEVRAESGAVDVAGGVGSGLSFDLSSGGTVEVELQRDGISLGTFSLGTRNAGTHSLDLADLQGAPPLEDGTYSVSIRHITAEGTVTDVPTFVQGQVTGVDLNAGSPVLLLGSRRIDVSSVREVRDSFPTDTPTTESDPPADEPAPAA